MNARWLWITGVAAMTFACRESYPIAPSLCDDWCEAIHDDGTYCNVNMSPASCVSECEKYPMPKQSECVALFQTWIDCLRHREIRPDCSDRESSVCNAQHVELLKCEGTYYPPPDPDASMPSY
jgi:hypothetical protein